MHSLYLATCNDRNISHTHQGLIQDFSAGGGGGKLGKGGCVGVSCNKKRSTTKWCICFQGPEFNAGSDFLSLFFLSVSFYSYFFFSFSPFLHNMLVKSLFPLFMCVGQNVCDSVRPLYRADNVNCYRRAKVKWCWF